MKLVGMLPVRNEEWCLGLSLRVALIWCDEVVVLLHACTDRSNEIVEQVGCEYPGRVYQVWIKDNQWDEMNHRQWMLKSARSQFATHLAIIDADEVLTGNLIGEVRDCCAILPSDGRIVEFPGYNLRNGIEQYHSNGIWGNRWFSTAFADDARLSWTGDRFHHREPLGVALKPYRPIQQGQGGVLHLWAASKRRLRAKHAHYKVIERLRWPHKHVSQIDREYSWAIHGDKQNPSFGTPQTWTYSTVPESWWASYRELAEKYLDLDAIPWQTAEVQRLIKLHGKETFLGLDLFGVDNETT